MKWTTPLPDPHLMLCTYRDSHTVGSGYCDITDYDRVHSSHKRLNRTARSACACRSLVCQGEHKLVNISPPTAGAAGCWASAWGAGWEGLQQSEPQ